MILLYYLKWRQAPIWISPQCCVHLFYHHWQSYCIHVSIEFSVSAFSNINLFAITWIMRYFICFFTLWSLKGCIKSVIFNFLPRCLLSFLSCICASAHTIPCSKLECWCFTHWHPDRPAQLTCLWYARKFLFIHFCFLPNPTSWWALAVYCDTSFHLLFFFSIYYQITS